MYWVTSPRLTDAHFAAGYKQPADFSSEAFGQLCVKTHDDHLNTTNKFRLTVKAPYLSVGAMGVPARVFACFAKENDHILKQAGSPIGFVQGFPLFSDGYLGICWKTIRRYLIQFFQIPTNTQIPIPKPGTFPWNRVYFGP